MMFYDEQSGATLRLDRWYGFADGGGLCGSFEGYTSLDEAKADILKTYPEYVRNTPDGDDVVGTTGETLGLLWCCILSGQQYLEELKKVRNLPLSVFGHFVDDNGNRIEGEGKWLN